MLILQRKKNQSITIGNDITITIVDVVNDQVKIAIDAPRSIPIVRSELLEAARINLEASVLSKETFHSLSQVLHNKEKIEGEPQKKPE